VRFLSAPTPLRESVRPRNLSTLSCRANCCQPFAITGFPPVIHNGESLSGREKLKRGELFNDNATTLFRLQWQGLFGACRSGRRSNLKKIAGRFCFSRNPSGTLFPNANPETRGQFGGFFYSMPESLIRFRQTQTPRQSSSDLKFIAERQKLCKGNQECHVLPSKTRYRRSVRKCGRVRFRRVSAVFSFRLHQRDIDGRLPRQSR